MLAQCPINGAVSSIIRIHKPRNHGEEMGGAPFPITFSNPQAKCLLPVPTTLFSASPEVLYSDGGMLP